jgi:two-component system, OmpR family, sensor histidine kinase BaeS
MIGDRLKERKSGWPPWRQADIKIVPPHVLRSLTLKLTLAFLGVGLVGALLVALFVGQRTLRAFDQFVVDRGQRSLITALAQHYQRNGSWEGVASVLRSDRLDQPGPSQLHQYPVVCNKDGRVVLGGGKYPPGARVSARERMRGVPISVDGTTVGWLLSSSGRWRPERSSPEGALLERITQAITYSAVGASALALLLGVLLARTLTQPLRELTAATQVVASGRLGQQVQVRSRDELGVLAASFNRMSADLARASALRRQMTADIAHDLRTPLSVILGYTEALREGMLPATQDIFDTIHIEAQHLQRLIDDLRTLSLADAGELSLTRQPVDPRSLLERAVASHTAQAQARHISLSMQAAGSLPPVVVDPERMAQVLSNLLSNALRYTPPSGSITLLAEVAAGQVYLRVKDTGAGIAPEALPHVFDRFYRADPSREQDGSSGLGLAIAKSIVEAHGGQISVESVPGHGATFTIALPVADADRSARQP